MVVHCCTCYWVNRYPGCSEIPIYCAAEKYMFNKEGSCCTQKITYRVARGILSPFYYIYNNHRACKCSVKMLRCTPLENFIMVNTKIRRKVMSHYTYRGPIICTGNSMKGKSRRVQKGIKPWCMQSIFAPIFLCVLLKSGP